MNKFLRISTMMLMLLWILQGCQSDLNDDLLAIPPDDETEEPDEPAGDGNDKIIVVMEYFAGWHADPAKDDKWRAYNAGVDFSTKPEYAGRAPLLGHYNTQQTMDADILCASSYGVDVFSILWYYWGNADDTGSDNVTTIKNLNKGLAQYQASPNKSEMKFMMEVTNADGALSITSVEQWNEIIDIFVEAAKDTTYFRMEGRPVVKIHDGSRFYNQLGGAEGGLAKCQTVINNFRQKAASAGLGDILVAVGTYGAGSIPAGSVFVTMGANCCMQYAGIDETKPVDHYPFTELGVYTKKLRDLHKNDAIPWIPYVMSDWDASPWGGEGRSTFEFATRGEWESELRKIKGELLASTTYGFPRKDGTKQKAFTIYAWNEYGEGGIVAPTEGTQYMKVEVIKSVFGVDPWYNMR